MRLKQFIIEDAEPDVGEGEFAVRFRKKKKVPKLNKKTNRMKNSRQTRWFKTDIGPKDRSLDNLPRYADKNPKCTFQEWLGVKGGGSDGSKGTDGKFYGWSHRAIWGFGVGDEIKPDHIGNKYQYSKKNQDKYNDIWDNEGSDAADKFYKSITFDPYTIRTEKDAKEHAIRFGRSVS